MRTVVTALLTVVALLTVGAASATLISRVRLDSGPDSVVVDTNPAEITVRTPGFPRGRSVDAEIGTVVLVEVYLPAGGIRHMPSASDPSTASGGSPIPDNDVRTMRLLVPDGLDPDDAEEPHGHAGLEVVDEYGNLLQSDEAAEILDPGILIGPADVGRHVRARFEVTDELAEGEPVAVAVAGIVGYPTPITVTPQPDVPLSPPGRAAVVVIGEPESPDGPWFAGRAIGPDGGDPFVSLDAHHTPNGTDPPADGLPISGTVHYPGDLIRVEQTWFNWADESGNADPYFDGPAVARGVTFGLYVPDGPDADEVQIVARIDALNAAPSLHTATLELPVPAHLEVPVIGSSMDGRVVRDLADWSLTGTDPPIGSQWDSEDRQERPDPTEDPFDGATWLRGQRGFASVLWGVLRVVTSDPSDLTDPPPFADATDADDG